MLDLAHSYSSIAMFGVIWLIQLVHYPSFFFIADHNFVQFERFHTRSISFIVMPLMLIELFSILAIAFITPNYTHILLLLITISIWVITFSLSIPCHKKLLKKKDYHSIKSLIKTNWARTILWTLKLIILIYVA